jgi:DNA repair exonuclease SbcCD ATPase subunit
MNSSSKNYCHICGMQFNFSNSKKSCPSCKLPVCKLHSNNGLNSVCDFCYKEELIKKYEYSHKDLKDKLKSELMEIKQQLDNNQTLSSDQDIHIKHFQSNLKIVNDKINNVTFSIQEKIKKESERNAVFQENLNNLKKSTEELARAKKIIEAQIESVNSKLMDNEDKINKYLQEKATLENEKNELKAKLQLYIPLKSIKGKICKLCFHKIQYLNRSIFESRISEKEFITRQACCCNLI